MPLLAFLAMGVLLTNQLLYQLSYTGIWVAEYSEAQGSCTIAPAASERHPRGIPFVGFASKFIVWRWCIQSVIYTRFVCTEETASP